jgi:hypothetical protein
MYGVAAVQQLQLLFPVTSKRFCPVAVQPVISKTLHHHRVAVVAGSIANTMPSPMPSPHHPAVLPSNTFDPCSPDSPCKQLPSVMAAPQRHVVCLTLDDAA